MSRYHLALGTIGVGLALGGAGIAQAVGCLMAGAVALNHLLGGGA